MLLILDYINITSEIWLNSYYLIFSYHSILSKSWYFCQGYSMQSSYLLSYPGFGLVQSFPLPWAHSTCRYASTQAHIGLAQHLLGWPARMISRWLRVKTNYSTSSTGGGRVIQKNFNLPTERHRYEINSGLAFKLKGKGLQSSDIDESSQRTEVVELVPL